MRIEQEQICNLVKENNYRNYSFIGKLADILADNINDYIDAGGTIEEWFADYNYGGIEGGMIPQLVYNSDVYSIFEIHYRDLFGWLYDQQKEMKKGFTLTELNDGGMLPIKIVYSAFDWLAALAYINMGYFM